MEYRLLGRTGVKVSGLCFGTMTFGGDADEATSAALFARCREAGVNYFDTADAYTSGRSEEILGKLMVGCRDELVVATKFSSPIRAADVNARGGSRRHMREAVEASLRRLGTDRIDLCYVHFPDPDTPLDETLRGLDDLVRQGKVLYLGISNFPAWQIATALGISAREGLARFEAIQPMYSLLKRQAEVEILPLARHAGLAVCPYNAIAGGVLSGKYAGPGVTQGRLLDNPRYRARYDTAWIPDAVDRFVAYARQHGHHPVSLAVAWVAAHPAVTAPLVGARTAAQIEASLRSVEIRLTPEQWAEIAALVPHPGVATDRTENLAGFTDAPGRGDPGGPPDARPRRR
jgi:aryl-alcohol dehydrogenase-like predicted oxidoreductase